MRMNKEGTIHRVNENKPATTMTSTSRPTPYLPPEIHLIIAEHLPRADLCAYIRTSSFFHSLLEPYLLAEHALSDGGIARLHWACRTNRLDVLISLLEKAPGPNLSPDLRIFFYPAPLHHAILNGHERIVKALLDHGADLEARVCVDHISLPSFSKCTTLPKGLCLSSWSVAEVCGRKDIQRMLRKKGAIPHTCLMRGQYHYGWNKIGFQGR